MDIVPEKSTDITKCRVYLISPAKDHYIERVMTVFRRLLEFGFEKIIFVRSIEDPSKTNSLTKTFVSILEKELRTGGNEPFLIFEDDIHMNDVPKVINIPADVGAVYMGVCYWHYPHPLETLIDPDRVRSFRICPTTHDTYTSLNDTFVNIHGMTSAHAILFQSRTLIQKFLDEAEKIIPYNVPHDLLLATLQKDFNIVALKNPLCFQDNILGGQEEETNLSWDATDRMYHRVH